MIVEISETASKSKIYNEIVKQIKKILYEKKLTYVELKAVQSCKEKSDTYCHLVLRSYSYHQKEAYLLSDLFQLQDKGIHLLHKN